MRLAFAGTPPFAAEALERLAEAGHELALVLTQPDRPTGRGLHPAPSAVKRAALQRGIEVLQPSTLRDAQTLARVRAARPQALVVAAYGLLLPPEALALAPLGALNIHASLLPRWRGAAPIQRALLAGDALTGITIMQMNEGLDTGPILSQHSVPVSEDDDAGTLHDRLARLGAEAIVEVLAGLGAGRLKPVPQPAEGATYARKITKADTRLDWSRNADELERAVRAFRPSPGASTELAGEPLKVWAARVLPGGGEPGVVLEGDARLVVGCGAGSLELRELQRAGARRMSAGDFLRGRPLARGTRLL